MRINYRLFFNFGFIAELVIFILTQVAGLWVSFNFISQAILSQTVSVQSQTMSAWQFLLAFAIATLIVIAMLKYIKNPIVIRLIFYLAMFQGIWIFAASFLDRNNALIFLGFIILLYFFYSNVIIHDWVMIMALAGIAVVFGFNFMPSAVIAIMIILAIYDFIAVYKTKHMVSMFREMSQQKVNFAAVIPGRFKDFLIKLKNVSPDNQFMFLGTGDLIVPLIFTISCLHLGFKTSLFALGGSIIGFIVLYTIFMTQKERQPMPGLPPLVLGSLVGYLLSFVF